MARNSYRNRLEALRGDVLAMADTALDRYVEATEVLQTGDEQLARWVIDGDEELNRWYLDIEADCVELIALEQPVASDLRFIATSFKIVTDVERIGDLATNLARYGCAAEGELFDVLKIAPIATAAGELFEDAMEAYARDSVDAARQVAATDDELDDACQDALDRLVRELVTTKHMDDAALEATIEDVSRLLLTVRDLERVGDHAVNVAARTLYMVEADDSLLY